MKQPRINAAPSSRNMGGDVELGELLGLCRELKGLSQRDVEKHTKISNAFISQIETGKAEPSFRNAVLLCDCYGITLERLADTIRELKK